MIRQQSFSRQEIIQRDEYKKKYFREKYNCEDLDEDQLANAMEEIEDIWRKIEAELTEIDENES